MGLLNIDSHPKLLIAGGSKKHNPIHGMLWKHVLSYVEVQQQAFYIDFASN
jgi:hypothetical protein